MASTHVRLRTALLPGVLAAALALAAPGPARADRATGSATGVAIPSSGAAVPAPIAIAGVPGEISAVRVTLVGLRHSEGSDLDVLLVSPGGATTLLASDVCSGNLPTSTITLDDAAGSALPGSSCAGGTFRPRNSGGSDTFSAPAPGSPYGGTLAALVADGHATPNGTWKLYVQDDRSGSSGNLASWSIEIDTIVHLPATGSIGTASAYPWTRTVPASAGAYLRDVDVVLDGVTHHFFGEVGGVLQGPDGRSTVLFAGACGNAIFTDRSLRFDDAALDPLPISNVDSCWNDPAYRPMDATGTGAPLPAPAPVGAGLDLSAYEGRSGAGTWRLWLADGGGGDAGTVRDWSLAVRASGPAPLRFQYPAVQGQEGRTAQIVITRADTEGILGEATVAWEVLPDSADAADVSTQGGTVTFARGQAEASLPIRVVDDGLFGEDAESLDIALTSATGDASVDAGPYTSLNIAADLPSPDFTGDDTTDAPDAAEPGAGSATAQPVAADVVVLPPAKACVRAGKLKVSFKRPRGKARVTRVQVIVNGRTVHRQSGAAALRAIPLSKVRRASRYKVVVRVTLSTKRVLTLRRTYKACAR